MNTRIWQVWFGNVLYGAISGGWSYHYGCPSGRRRRRTTLMIMAVRVSILVVSGRSWRLQLLLVMSDVQGNTPRRTRRRLPLMVDSVHIHWIVWWMENRMMNYICMLNSNGTCRRRRRRRRSSMIHICV